MKKDKNTAEGSYNPPPKPDVDVQRSQNPPPAKPVLPNSPPPPLPPKKSEGKKK